MIARSAALRVGKALDAGLGAKAVRVARKMSQRVDGQVEVLDDSARMRGAPLQGDALADLARNGIVTEGAGIDVKQLD